MGYRVRNARNSSHSTIVRSTRPIPAIDRLAAKDTMDSHDSPHRDRLWTPWRMRYIGGDAKEDGCIFCNRLASDNDVASLILHRADRAFVIMNLFPYNTGHVMVVPNTHAADLDALDEATIVGMATLLPRVVAALRRDLACQGFNIGLNLGGVAGAGVAEHLHQHVVPRWQGDANFMPILAGTMVIPEMIPATYAKVRAELERELHGAERFDVVPVSGEGVVWLHDGGPLAITAGSDQPVWRAAVAALGVVGAEVVGWSGSTRTDTADPSPGLVVRVATAPDGPGWAAVSLAEADACDAARRAVANMAPWIAAPSG
jgi:ATP adenylyltransferase